MKLRIVIDLDTEEANELHEHSFEQGDQNELSAIHNWFAEVLHVTDDSYNTLTTILVK